MTDKGFVATYFSDDEAERKILYEDAEHGFCTPAHVNHGAVKQAARLRSGAGRSMIRPKAIR